MKEIRRLVQSLTDDRREIRHFERLLKDYRKTGNKRFLAAAGCLKVPPLLDLQLRQRYLRPAKGRGQIVRKEARPRLYRMARTITAGASMLEAARREVETHGRGGHSSNDAAIDYLRCRYAADGAYIEGTLAAMDQLHAQWREFDRLVDLLRGPVLQTPSELLLPLQPFKWLEPHLISLLRLSNFQW